MATRWNNYTTPKNSKWLLDNLEVTDRLFNGILKLIDEDGDSFAKKAEMYYQRRPELISHVNEFYQRYRALAQRYDHATTDLAKNIPTDQIQSQCSGNWSELGIGVSVSSPSSPERKSEYKVNRRKPYCRAAGFDFFLGSGKSLDLGRKESEDSTSESGSECEYIKVTNGLQNELRETKDKLQEYRNSSAEHCENFPNGEFLEFSSASSSSEIRSLREAMEADAKKSEIEISHRDHIVHEYKSWIGAILNKSIACDEAEVNTDEKSSLEIKILEQEQVIMELKAMAKHSSNKLLREKSALEAKLCGLMASTNSYAAKLQTFEKRVKQLEEEKIKIRANGEKRIAELSRSLEESKLIFVQLTSEKDELDEFARDLNVECGRLIGEAEGAQKSSAELASRVGELEDEVERQRAAVADGAEEKREAIRQLCVSIEHYRVRYQRLWKKLQTQNGRPVIITAK